MVTCERINTTSFICFGFVHTVQKKHKILLVLRTFVKVFRLQQNYEVSIQLCVNQSLHLNNSNQTKIQSEAYSSITISKLNQYAVSG
jgi:hypothetical protein